MGDTEGKFEDPRDDRGLIIPERMKLTKNSKGYNWDIQINEINVKRLAEIDAKCVEKWGDGGN